MERDLRNDSGIAEPVAVWLDAGIGYGFALICCGSDNVAANTTCIALQLPNCEHFQVFDLLSRTVNVKLVMLFTKEALITIPVEAFPFRFDVSHSVVTLNFPISRVCSSPLTTHGFVERNGVMEDAKAQRN